MISLIAEYAAVAADSELQHELFVVLADHLAIGIDTRPGEVMAIDLAWLEEPNVALKSLRDHCRLCCN